MQVAIELDDAQLAGVAATMADFQKAEAKLQRVLSSILTRAKVANVIEWKLDAAESRLIVILADEPPAQAPEAPEETP